MAATVSRDLHRCFMFSPRAQFELVHAVARCSFLYGSDWDTYVRMVPYAFIPGVI